MPAVSHFTKPAQWSHYLRAVADIAFPAHSIRVAAGPSDGEVPSLPYPFNGVPSIHIVTAFNPGGRSTSVRANLRAQHELLHSIGLNGLQWWLAVGGDLAGTHAEISATVVGMDDAQARDLGRRFGQDAVFAWSPTAWRLLACTDTAHDSRSLLSRRVRCLESLCMDWGGEGAMSLMQAMGDVRAVRPACGGPGGRRWTSSVRSIFTEVRPQVRAASQPRSDGLPGYTW